MKFIRFLKVLFFIILIAFLFNALCPGIISNAVPVFPIGTEEWAVLLAGIDIVVTVLIAYSTWWEQNKEKERWQYRFDVASEYLSFNDYCALDSMNASYYPYYFDPPIQGVEQPYYVINVPLSQKHCVSFNIPFILTIQKCPDASRIVIDDVFVYIEKNGKQIKQGQTVKLRCQLGTSVSNGAKYLIRIALLSTFKQEQHLLNSRYFISMHLFFYSSDNKRTGEYVTVEVQSVNGKKLIRQAVSHKSYIAHLLWGLTEQ